MIVCILNSRSAYLIPGKLYCIVLNSIVELDLIGRTNSVLSQTDPVDR